jgi:hypothetical protein
MKIRKIDFRTVKKTKYQQLYVAALPYKKLAKYEATK